MAFLGFILLLLGTFSVTTLKSSLHSRRLRAEGFQKLKQPSFFYRKLHALFFPKEEEEGLIFATICTLTITRFLYGALALWITFPLLESALSWWAALLLVFLIITALFIGEYIPRLLVTLYPEGAGRLTAPIASCYLIASFPFTLICLKLFYRIFKKAHLEKFHEAVAQTKREIIDLVHKTRLTPELSAHDKKLIQSVLTFKEKIAREVMVPRVDLFTLSADISIRSATKEIEEEGFSRIPIYNDSIDNIVGVVMYKDILQTYMKAEAPGGDKSALDAPLSSIQKGVFYIPETKKISLLLQEFRKKQVHMAIVVDEYGGTEGIITIEDILEEIVGEIADEYDEDEEILLVKQNGSWIVDARMSIIDAEQKLGVKIPQESDYDTIGGYLFHCTGTIPPKGLIIDQENFQMEILDSDDRKVKKVRIRPAPAETDEEPSLEEDESS